jgi:hypothetical protein
LGTSGRQGPDSTKGYANAPWSQDQFSIVDGQQQWTVPSSGTYLIEAAGAYGAAPGRVVSGEVNLSEGQVVSLLVGQQPTPLTANVADNVTVGGGGGTFVTSKGKPLIIASGGDGGSYSSNIYFLNKTFTISGLIRSKISRDGKTIIILNETTISIFRKTNSWNLEKQISFVDSSVVALSSDGNTFVTSNSTGTYVFKFTNNIWNSGVAINQSRSSVAINGSGNVIVAGANSVVTVFTYSNGSWGSGVQLANTNSYPNFGTTLDISENSLVICVSSLSPTRVVIFNYSGSWNSGTALARTYNPYISVTCKLSSDGSTTLVNDGYYSRFYTYNSGNEYMVQYGSNINQADIALNSDGTIVLLGQSPDYTGEKPVNVYKFSGSWSLLNSIEPPAGSSGFGTSISMNSLLTEVLISQTNTSTFLYIIPSPQDGSFSPTLDGQGISGAGYLTNGQNTNPFLQFLVPSAYVNGGFGNSYMYGIKTEEGGFGGGQSPIGLLTTLTSLTGIANSYPTISNSISSYVSMSSDGTVVLKGKTIYRLSGSNWDSGTSLGSQTSIDSCVLSSDGTKAFVESSYQVRYYSYSGGSWSSATLINLASPLISINASGTRLCGVEVNVISTPLKIFDYSGGVWTGQTIVVGSYSGFTSSAMSADGNTIVIASWRGLIRVYKYSGSWDSGTNISTTTTAYTQKSVALNSNGTFMFVGDSNDLSGSWYSYSGGVWSLVTRYTSSVLSFGYSACFNSDATETYVGSGSSQLSIFKNQVFNEILNVGCDHVAFGNGTIAAGADSNVIFFNNTSHVTTCTAVTSIPHGYPHNYEVQITGTTAFNGTWDITTTSPTTFTFQTSGGSTETSGTVTGTVTGVSGGGGYTGSPGDGVSGATCYADSTVTNFTDLGATSNSAGYVTVSLIDPVPIKEKWTWDQIVQPLSGYVRPFESVQWSSQLNKFVSIASTSLNGIDWEGGGLIDQRSYDRIMYIAYSPELNIYVGVITQNFISPRLLKYSSDALNWTSTNVTDPLSFTSFAPHSCPIIWSSELSLFVCLAGHYIYTSLDGITWSTSLEMTPIIYQSAYAPSINTFVAPYGTGAMYSTDGINWIDATIPYGDLNCVSAAWSPSLSLFVMVSRSSSDSVLVSSDGQTWTTNGVTSSVLSYQWNAVVWADFCGKFTALGSQNGKSMYSSDGLDWNINGTTDDRWDDITVSNEQKIILAISQTNFLGSIDGVYWVQLQSPYPAYNGIWSSQLGLFVTSFGFNNNIYYSNDAVTWNSTFIPGNIQRLTWSPELGIMIGNDTGSILSPEASNIWYSYDGVSWALGTWSNDQPNTKGFNITWSPELGIFSGVAYSSDGINWTSGSVGTTSDSSHSCWSPELGLFVLLCVAGPITTYYYSTDGITWIMTQTDLIYPQTPIAYSPTLRRFVYYGYFGGFLVGYSDDGMTWNKIPVSYDISSINWNNELQIFISNIGTSLDGLTWSPYPTQNYLMESSGLWSPELKRFVCALGYSDAKRTF